MAIQTTIPAELISGIPGEISHDGPTRALSAIINSGSEANNVFGRAFTYADEAVETVQAGGTGLFAGIMINPKAYAISPTPRNGSSGEFLFMGEVYVSLATTGATIGDLVYFTNATGALGHGTAGAGQTQIEGAVVSRHNVSPQTPTLAVIRLTQ